MLSINITFLYFSEHCLLQSQIESCVADQGLFLCRDKISCLSAESVCNNQVDCMDGSDEFANCTSACLDHNCSDSCMATPKGPQCFCQSGFRLEKNQVCVDIDECETYGTCDQLCTNTMGSFECGCERGYHLDQDSRTCLTEGQESELLLVSDKNQVQLTEKQLLESKIYRDGMLKQLVVLNPVNIRQFLFEIRWITLLGMFWMLGAPLLVIWLAQRLLDWEDAEEADSNQRSYDPPQPNPDLLDEHEDPDWRDGVGSLDDDIVIDGDLVWIRPYGVRESGLQRWIRFHPEEAFGKPHQHLLHKKVLKILRERAASQVTAHTEAE